tara:strand:- start:293 stop:2053 length:1761 start_codon:yes stop_codon:yes gene_type:complete
MKEVICITGPLLSFSSREEAKNALEKAGHEVKSSVTRSVTILVNETGVISSKSKKAASAGLPVINNLDFLINKGVSVKKLREKKLKSKTSFYKDLKKTDKKLYNFLKVIKSSDQLHVITSGTFFGTNEKGFHSRIRDLFFTKLGFEEITLNGKKLVSKLLNGKEDELKMSDYISSFNEPRNSKPRTKRYLVILSAQNLDLHSFLQIPFIEAENISNKIKASERKGNKGSLSNMVSNYNGSVVILPDQVTNLLGLPKKLNKYNSTYFEVNCRAKRRDFKTVNKSSASPVYVYKNKYVYRDLARGWGKDKSPLDLYFFNDGNFSFDKKSHHNGKPFFSTNRLACHAIDLTEALMPMVTKLNPIGLPDFAFATHAFLKEFCYSKHPRTYDQYLPWEVDYFGDYAYMLGPFLERAIINPEVNISRIPQIDLLCRFSNFAKNGDSTLPHAARRGQDLLNFFKRNRKSKIYDKAMHRFESILSLCYLHPDKRVSFSYAHKKSLTESPVNRNIIKINLKIIAEILVDHWLYNHPFFFDIENNYLDKAQLKRLFQGSDPFTKQLSHGTQLIDVFIKDDLERLARIVEIKEREEL